MSNYGSASFEGVRPRREFSMILTRPIPSLDTTSTVWLTDFHSHNSQWDLEVQNIAIEN